jgi:ABC-type sugar transport system ATPase subunit
MAGVKLENVLMKYGGLVALNHISFECREGEFFTLLGPSGAGKTTTFELIAGIKQHLGGHINIGGRRVDDLPPHERNVAMAFENYALYPHFSVYENIAFTLRSPRRKAKLSEEQIRVRVDEITTLLGISELLERKPQHLSGGQKQRVSLARAMVRRPDVYLLDEPIAHLDAKLKVTARSTLKQLAAKLGTTIIYVTHNYREALGLSDRVLVLRKGNVEQIGDPRELYHHPASDFVAQLIGYPPINLVDGEVMRENGQVYFQAGPDFRIPIRSDQVGKMEKALWQEDGKDMVRLGIRPQNVSISNSKISEAAFQLPVYVMVREAESAMITFELSQTFFQVQVNTGEHYNDGDMVWAEIVQDHLFFFPKTVELKK